MLCSILLLDSEGKHLLQGAAPSLPDFYNSAIDGIEIGDGVGSCGTAAFRGERVIVNDIATHPHWAAYKDLAARAGLGSCWSQPVLSSTGQVLGTFAIYHHNANTPTQYDLSIIEQTARLASIAIERKQIEDKVHRLAFYDSLTKLANRILLIDRLSQAMAASQRSRRYGALMFLDMDNFKSLNDAHGHVAGDLLLMEVANRLKNCIREIDTASRFGGDEFVVMITELDTDKNKSALQARIVAKKILQALSEPYLLTINPMEKGGLSVEHQCTASIGVTLFLNHECSQEDIVKRADKAMYQAKDAGRNLICLL
jgi:diguanylate cyclase (GGDEF)-like protein